MPDIILFAVGSSLAVDYEESAARAGIRIVAGIRNIEAAVALSVDVPIVDTWNLTSDLRALEFSVPLFTPGHRQSACLQAGDLGLTSPANLIDPTAIVPRRIELGRGIYVNAGCVLGAAGAYGDFALINRAAAIGHHVTIESFSSIGPGAVLGGHVTIGAGAVIGAGATVLPKVRIGRNSVVAAGSVVTSDVADRDLVAGNPARVKRSGIRGYGEVAVII